MHNNLFTIFRSLVAMYALLLLVITFYLTAFYYYRQIKNIFNDFWVLISDFMH